MNPPPGQPNDYWLLIAKLVTRACACGCGQKFRVLPTSKSFYFSIDHSPDKPERVSVYFKRNSRIFQESLPAY